jgi:preprotein translocase subunit SecA
VGTNDEQEYYYENEEHTPQLTVEHESSLDSLGAGLEDMGPTDQLAVKQTPVRSQKVANRNDKVNVQYMDGTVKRDVKYKAVEQDVESGRAVLVD